MFKKLLTILSISCLLQIQVNFESMSLSVEANQAYAQSESDNSSTITVQKTEEMKSSGLGDGALNIITMMVMGFVVSRLVFLCKPVPTDVMVAAGSAAAYLAGEIMSMNKYKEMEKENINYAVTNDGSGTEEQVKFLMAQRQGYQDVKETAEMKMKFQLAAAAGFGGAGLMAIFMDSKEKSELTTCGGCSPQALASLKTQEFPISSIPGLNKSIAESAIQLSQCTAASAASVGAASGGMIGCSLYETSVLTNHTACAQISVAGKNMGKKFKHFAGLGNYNVDLLNSVVSNFAKESAYDELDEGLSQYGDLELMAELNPYYLTSNLKEDSANVLETYIYERELDRYYKGEVSSLSLDEYNSFKDRINESIEFSGKESTNNLLILAASKGINLLVPSVKANVFGLVGASATVAAGLLIPINTQLDTFLSNPAKRKYLYFLITTTAGLASAQSKSVADKAQDNIDAIDKIIKRLNIWKEGSGEADQGFHKLLSAGSFKPYMKGSPVQVSNTNQPIECVIPGSSPGKCGTMSTALKASPVFSQLPSSLAGIASDVATVTDGVQGQSTLSGGTISNIDSLGGNSGIINSKFAEKMKEFDKNNPNIKKSSDVNKELLAGVNNSAMKALRKSGMSPSGFLSKAGISAPAPLTDEEKEKKEEQKVADKKAPLKIIPKTKTPNFDFKLDSGSSATEMAMNQKAVDELNASRESKEDIVKDRDVSIFKVLNSRYLKSGYPRVLEELSE